MSKFFLKQLFRKMSNRNIAKEKSVKVINSGTSADLSKNGSPIYIKRAARTAVSSMVKSGLRISCLQNIDSCVDPNIVVGAYRFVDVFECYTVLLGACNGGDVANNGTHQKRSGFLDIFNVVCP